MHPILFSLGPLHVYTYGFCIFLGVLAAYFYGAWLGKTRYGVNKDDLADIAFWGLVAGFISARLLYILVEFPSFLRDPLAYVFTTSGFVFLGGLVGAAATAAVICRMRRIATGACFDLIACVMPLAHAFGRIGCFMYGCCYGKVCEHAGFLCFLFPEGSPAGMVGKPVIATQLIESASLFALTGALFFLHKKIRTPGLMAAVYVASYGVIRFVIEFWRGDAERGFWGVFSTSQWLSLGMVLIAIAAGAFLMRRRTASTQS